MQFFLQGAMTTAFVDFAVPLNVFIPPACAKTRAMRRIDV
jgi:hypothetical protein